MHREQLIAEAEAYQRDGMPLPLDLYAALMAEGIDASLYNEPLRQSDEDDKDIHNVD